MENKNNKGVIILLIVIIVMLAAFCVLLATGTIGFKSNDVDTNKPNDNVSNNNELNNNDNNYQANNIKVDDIKRMFKVAYDYYESSTVYCGKIDHAIVKIYGTDRHASTEFSTYEEMLNSLKNYMSVEVIAGKTPWAATTKEYYLEQDGKLYCEETYKGDMYGYGNVEVEITSQTEKKVSCVATMELIDPNEEKTYDKVNIVLEAKEDNWIITSYDKQNKGLS